MTLAFREALTSLLPAPQDALQRHLGQMSAAEWAALSEVLAARLPEFDAVIALPGAEVLGEQVAQMRGVPLLRADLGTGRPRWDDTALTGEALLVTAQLESGEAELAAVQQARAQGLTVPVLAAAVERTSLGGRQRLTQTGAVIRAALQLADTPHGLNVERRAPDRWLSSA